MATFKASLRTAGARSGLATTVRLEKGRLSIKAGEEPIGDWDLSEVTLEKIATGFRMDVEGEQVLLDMTESEALALDLRHTSSTRSQRRKKPAKKTQPKQPRSQRQPSKEKKRRPKEPRSQRKPVKEKQSRPKKPRSWRLSRRAKRSVHIVRRFLPKPGKLLIHVDSNLERAEKRWGALLPRWIFTRLMLAIALGALVAALVRPALVSTILLVSGLVLVILGGAAYADTMLAAKWLPGRTTPVHVLLFGMAVLLLGVLLGLVAR